MNEFTVSNMRVDKPEYKRRFFMRLEMPGLRFRVVVHQIALLTLYRLPFICILLLITLELLYIVKITFLFAKYRHIKRWVAFASRINFTLASLVILFFSFYLTVKNPASDYMPPTSPQYVCVGLILFFILFDFVFSLFTVAESIYDFVKPYIKRLKKNGVK